MTLDQKLALLVASAFIVCGICYGMSTTASHEPNVVCLSRPWLDVKPPC